MPIRAVKEEMFRKVPVISLGVFLGILAAVWTISRYQENRKWNEELDKTMAETTLTLLKPDDVIARCGKPIKDVFYPELHVRMLIYQDSVIASPPKKSPADSRETTLVVTIEFDQLRNMSWAFRGMSKGSVELPDVVKVKGDAREQIQVLPCIEGKK